VYTPSASVYVSCSYKNESPCPQKSISFGRYVKLQSEVKDEDIWVTEGPDYFSVYSRPGRE
jgi:hypothetical protein